MPAGCRKPQYLLHPVRYLGHLRLESSSQFSGSHLSQLSGPLFTEDRYSASSGDDQEACGAEVDHIMHHKTPFKASTIPIIPGRPTSAPDTVDYSTQGDPDQAAP